MIAVNPAICLGCGDCMRACPQDAIIMEEGIANIQQAQCNKCGICLDVCPLQAIARVEITPPQAEKLITKPMGSSATKVKWGAALAALSMEILPKVLPVLIDKISTSSSKTGRATTHQTGSRSRQVQRSRMQPGNDVCICRNCGFTHPHQQGNPCRLMTCPRCGGQMRRR